MATSQPQPQVIPATKPEAALDVQVNGELTPEERKQRLEEVRKRMSMRVLEVIGPTDWMPYWAYSENEQDMARLEYMGYRVVRETPNTPKRYQTAIKCRDDGTYRVGDVILVEIPREIWEFHRAEEKEKGEMMVKGATQNFIEETLRQGVPVFEVDSKRKVVSTKKL